MAAAQPFRVSPSLGPDLTQVVKAGSAWYDNGVGSPQLGDTCFTSDGRKGVYVEASASIAVVAGDGTQVALTVNGPGDITAATDGSGGYYAPNSGDYGGTIAEGDRFWAIEGTAP